jgi:hypothetical protein
LPPTRISDSALTFIKLPGARRETGSGRNTRLDPAHLVRLHPL